MGNFNFKSERPIRKKYFTVKEVSETLNESNSCVRFWADQFMIGHRKNNKNRIFTRLDIANLHVVKTLLRIEKFTLEGAKLKLIKYGK